MLHSEGFDWDDLFRDPKWKLKQRTLALRIVTFAQIHPSYHPDTNKSQLKQTLKN